MSNPSLQCWLERDDGVRIRIVDLLVLGREVDCDIIFPNPRVSKKQALIRTSAGFPELICLGRHPTRVNGDRVDGTRRLRDGDELEIVEARYVVRIQGDPDQTPNVWMLELPDRTLAGIQRSPFTVGGDQWDHIHLPHLPPSALCFLQAQGALVLEPGVDLQVAGEVVQAGDLAELSSMAVIELQDFRFKIYVQRPGSVKSTLHSAEAPPLPLSVRLELLPSGGRLRVTFEEGEAQVHLSEQRADLLALLLRPPGSYVPGDFIPDELVLPRVWPGNKGKDRTDLNVLLFRIRRDLLRAGINPFRVLERLKGGGATRFRLVPGAQVAVD